MSLSISSSTSRLSEDQLELIVDTIADGVLVHNQDGKIIYANIAAARMCGYSTVATLLEDNGSKTRTRFELFNEDGNPFDYDKLPSKLAFDGEHNPEAIIGYRRISTGKERWSRMRSRSIKSAQHGRIVTTVLTDITREREIQKRKDDFLSIASHELKTPLTSTMGFTQLLTKQISQLSTDQITDYLKKINKYLDKTHKLVSELLDISKIQSGRIHFNKDFFDIQEVARIVIGEMQIICPRHSLVLHSTGAVNVYADRSRISQVFINLITNAAKYSAPGTTIILEINEQDDDVEVAVHDFGIGIPAAEREHIFERFYRVNESPTSVDGLGIGLYISHAIIARHGGTMRVESEEGKGSSFYFTLPKEEMYA